MNITPKLLHSAIFVYPLVADKFLRDEGILDLVRQKNDSQITIAALDEHAASRFVQDHLYRDVGLWEFG